MQNPISHHLTKSRYMAGLQCPRRLWLQVHEPLLDKSLAVGVHFGAAEDVAFRSLLRKRWITRSTGMERKRNE
jgi:hypothetical protein